MGSLIGYRFVRRGHYLHVSAGGKQCPDKCAIARAGGEHEWRFLVWMRGIIDLHSRMDQELGNLGVSTARGYL